MANIRQADRQYTLDTGHILALSKHDVKCECVYFGDDLSHIQHTHMRLIITDGCMTNKTNDVFCIRISEWILLLLMLDFHGIPMSSNRFNKMMWIFVFNDTIDYLRDVRLVDDF